MTNIVNVYFIKVSRDEYLRTRYYPQYNSEVFGKGYTYEHANEHHVSFVTLDRKTAEKKLENYVTKVRESKDDKMTYLLIEEFGVECCSFDFDKIKKNFPDIDTPEVFCEKLSERPTAFDNYAVSLNNISYSRREYNAYVTTDEDTYSMMFETVDEALEWIDNTVSDRDDEGIHDYGLREFNAIGVF